VTYADVSPDVRGSDEMGWTFGGAPIDYVGFARSLGLQAVQASTANELAGALAQATDSQEPWLIEVKTVGFAGK